MTLSRLLLVSLLFAGLLSTTLAETRRVERHGTIFHTYITTPDRISLFWLDPSGKPFHQFSTLQTFLVGQNKRIRFLMNGGIFEEGGIPSGLLVIDGKTLNPLNTNPGKGNFFLQPNGVFYVDHHGAHVLATSDYVRTNPRPLLAIQSGPLLLRDGNTHPAFRADSKSYLHRNGVGILPDGRVLFVITEFGQPRYANLFEFADFFRAQGCRNALFLDGDISQMKIDPSEPLTPNNYFGTIFAVVE